jgi:hypothetical protein
MGFKNNDGSNLAFRFDQGTGDGEGHLFCASNFGHMIFIDYTSNPNKYINDNVLIHVQWLDEWLDDLAPLAGYGSEGGRGTTDNSGFSSSFSGLSSSGGNLNSSSSVGGGVSLSSSGTVILSSSSTGSVANSSSGGNNNSGSSSSISTNPGSSSSSVSGAVSAGNQGSSSSGGTSGSTGSGNLEFLGSSSFTWVDLGGGTIPDTTQDNYPSKESRDKADSIVGSTSLIKPVDPINGGNNLIEIGGNYYEKVPVGKEPIENIGNNVAAGETRDSVPVGNVVEMVLDVGKILDVLDLPPGSEIKVAGSEGIEILDPGSSDPTFQDTISLSLTGSEIPIWLTSPGELDDGHIYFITEDGRVFRYGSIDFYDPIPTPEISILKDTDGDGKKDEIEVFFDAGIPDDIKLEEAKLVVNGNAVTLGDDGAIEGDRITLDISGQTLPPLDEIGDDDKLILDLVDENGVHYEREIPLSDFYKPVLLEAVVLRNEDGTDSLVVRFNVPMTQKDLELGNQIILFNGEVINPDLLRLMARDLVIFEQESYILINKDSVSLFRPLALENMPYIVSEEFDRNVPVTVVDRIPVISKESGYYDNDGNGVMDSIVVSFEKSITLEELKWLEFAFPWYSNENKLLYLIPENADLVLSSDGKSIGWKVQSEVPLKPDLTIIPAALPPSKLHVTYPVLNGDLVEDREFDLADHLPPVIIDAKIKLGKGSDFDTLTVWFSEEIDVSSIKPGEDLNLFSFYNGKTDTLGLQAYNVIWADDGKSVKLVLKSGEDYGLYPGDSLFISFGDPNSPGLKDSYGNIQSGSSKSVVVRGDIVQVVEVVNMGKFNSEDKDLQEVAAVTLNFVPSYVRGKDLKEEGELGHLVEIGQRLMPQLLAQINSGDGELTEADLDPEKVVISYSTYYFDHLGQYVADKSEVVPCDHESFEGNCLTSNQKMFISWNFKTNDNRFVGSGVYLVQFKLLIRYEKTQIVEEMIDKWGVRREN